MDDLDPRMARYAGRHDRDLHSAFGMGLNHRTAHEVPVVLIIQSTAAIFRFLGQQDQLVVPAALNGLLEGDPEAVPFRGGEAAAGYATPVEVVVDQSVFYGRSRGRNVRRRRADTARYPGHRRIEWDQCHLQADGQPGGPVRPRRFDHRVKVGLLNCMAYRHGPMTFVGRTRESWLPMHLPNSV